MPTFMPTPAISVAMSVYNGERFLVPAIDSVLAQSFTDFEFLILDDGSTDGSRAIITRYAAADPRIRPIFRDNKGLIVSLNQLLAESRGGLVARIDADDVCCPTRFAAQVDFLSAHPDYGVVGTLADDIDEYDAPYPLNLLPHPLNHGEFLAAIDSGGPLLCHPSVMFRRDIVAGVGGYHAAFRHCEDLDLWLRLASVTKLGNVPEKLLRYRHYEQQVSSRHATEQHIGAAVAKLAWRERTAGRPDPTEQLDRLPPIAGLDTLFGCAGVSREVRATVAHGLLHSRVALRDHGFDIVLEHLNAGGTRHGMWRTVARLCRWGEPARAARLATTLASSRTA